MRLLEFADDDPLRVKLVAVASQLKSRIGTSPEKLTADELLQLLRDEGIGLSKSDLFDMVKKDPLKNIIANISDNEVIFKGQNGEKLEPGPDENEKTLKSMAKKAIK